MSVRPSVRHTPALCLNSYTYPHIVTLKFELEQFEWSWVQDHSNWYHLKGWVRFPIRVSRSIVTMDVSLTVYEIVIVKVGYIVTLKTRFGVVQDHWNWRRSTNMTFYWSAVVTIALSCTIFSPSGSPTILVFPHQIEWKYSDGDPHNGGVECKEGMKKNYDFRPYLALSRNWCKIEP